MIVYEYTTAKQVGEGFFRDRGSKFLAYAFPIQSEQDVKRITEQLKSDHPKSRHVCYSWRLKPDASHYRINDDGEPSGSAGRPIYDAIRSAGLTNVGVFVVRYFGGTKLGVPGLINAYGVSAQEAIQAAGSKNCEVKQQFSLSCTYEQLPRVMQFLHSTQVKIIEQEYGEANVFLLERPLENSDKWAVDCINFVLESYETKFEKEFSKSKFSIHVMEIL